MNELFVEKNRQLSRKYSKLNQIILKVTIGFDQMYILVHQSMPSLLVMMLMVQQFTSVVHTTKAIWFQLKLFQANKSPTFHMEVPKYQNMNLK